MGDGTAAGPAFGDDVPARDCVAALAASAGYPVDAARAVLQALDVAMEAVLLVDANRRVLYCNRRAAELTGSRAEDLLGRSCSEAMRFVTCGEHCALFDEGALCGRHCELKNRAGASVHVVKEGRVLRDAQGRVVGGVEALRDVTDLARQARRLEAQCHLLEAFTRSVDEAVLAVDREGRVTCLSPHAAELLALGAGKGNGAALSDLVEDGGELDARLRRALEQGERAELRQVRLRRAGARPRWATLRLAPLQEPDGALLGAAVVVLAESELAAAPAGPLQDVVAASPAMRRLLQVAGRLAGGDANVLITGETGSGKEVLARALHLAGPRRDRPFHAVNCAALTGTLLESELFGHERGAFTDAVHAKPGRLELCEDGTLLLDEVGCLPAGLQAKLLRVLEQREFERVGGTRTLRLRARVVAATNSDLEAQVRAGAFRPDLYYRLRVVPLEVPPLRSRREDVVPLARRFLRELRGESADFTAAARRALEAWPWPGNVRELRNAVQFAVAMGGRTAVDVFDLPPEFRRAAAGSATGASARGRILEALEQARWNHSVAARKLGVSRTTLWRRMQKLGLDRDGPKR